MMVFSKVKSSMGDIFRDRCKVSPGYVPRELVNREGEFRKLVRLFEPLFEKGVSQRVLICGEGGTGKTALGRRFARELRDVSSKRDIDLRCVYVDPRKWRTEPGIAFKVAKANDISVPRRGYSAAEYLRAMKNRLEEDDRRLLIIFDWIDFHVKEEGSDFLYSLTRLWENSDKPNRVSLIGISRDPNFPEILDKTTRSTFLHNGIRLDHYTCSEVRQILRDRVKEAFKAGVVGEEALDLIANNARVQDGAGFAMEWLGQAGMVAVEEDDKEVGPGHVLEAKSRVHAQVPTEHLMVLDRQELLLLLAYARKERNISGRHVLTGELREEYEEVCEKYGDRPRKYTRFWEFIGELSNLGVIKTEPSKEGSRGNSRKISIPGVCSRALESALERSLKERKNSFAMDNFH